jgi:hypothetical protein
MNFLEKFARYYEFSSNNDESGIFYGILVETKEWDENVIQPPKNFEKDITWLLVGLEIEPEYRDKYKKFEKSFKAFYQKEKGGKWYYNPPNG